MCTCTHRQTSRAGETGRPQAGGAPQPSAALTWMPTPHVGSRPLLHASDGKASQGDWTLSGPGSSPSPAALHSAAGGCACGGASCCPSPSCCRSASSSSYSSCSSSPSLKRHTTSGSPWGGDACRCQAGGGAGCRSVANMPGQLLANRWPAVIAPWGVFQGRGAAVFDAQGLMQGRGGTLHPCCSLPARCLRGAGRYIALHRFGASLLRAVLASSLRSAIMLHFRLLGCNFWGEACSGLSRGDL